MPFLPNCVINIYKSSDKINSIWIGTTDINGKAIDIYGNPPNLTYGEYIAIAEHCDYDTEETIQFTVPETTVMPMSIGCNSAITAHETLYDHTQLSQQLKVIAAPSTVVKFSNPTYVTTSSTSFVKMKETVINQLISGTFTITFSFGATYSNGGGYAYVTLNDVQVGPLYPQPAYDEPSTKTQNLTVDFKIGDSLKVYGRAATGGTVSASDFNIAFIGVIVLDMNATSIS